MKHLLLLPFLLYLSCNVLAQLDENKIAILHELAKNNEASAQFELAEHFAAGFGVEQSFSDAFYWYQKAAEQNHLAAMFNLATAYDLGEGTTQNYQLAIDWYKKSAMQGEPSAAYNVGIFYDEGLGVKKDALKASIWLRVADLLNHELADEALRSTSTLLSNAVKEEIEKKAQGVYQQIQDSINKKQ